MQTIDDLDVAGKRVFVRADLNVPLSGTDITDDGRIRAVAPTIAKLVAAGAKVIGWYDNEWGYSNRLADLTALVGARL